MAHFYQDCTFDVKLFNRNMDKSLRRDRESRLSRGSSSKDHAVSSSPKPSASVTVTHPDPPFPPPCATPGSVARPLRVQAADAVASKVCRILGWSQMTAKAFIRRSRVIHGFQKDPLHENEELQSQLKDLYDNIEAGDYEEAEKNAFYLRDTKF